MSTILLPPSPVQEVFGEIRWGYVASLELSKLEQTLLSSGEANPIEYTLSNNDDAVDFIQLLLKVLDQVIHPIYRRTNSAGDMRRLLRDDGPAAQGPPTPLEVLENEPHNVIKHFLIAKLCEVVDCLRSGNLRSVSFASTFFINGFLLEGWQTLMHILERGGIDVFTQRKCYHYTLVNSVAMALLATALLNNFPCSLFVSHTRRRGLLHGEHSHGGTPPGTIETSIAIRYTHPRYLYEMGHLTIANIWIQTT